MITGMGVVCANADNKTEFADACFSGKVGIKECTAFNTEGLLTPYFGQVDSVQGEDRFHALLQKSAEEMMSDAKIDREYIASMGSRCRMFFGTLLYGADAYYKHNVSKSQGIPNTHLAHINDFSVYAKDILGVKGTVTVISSACASGTTAAGMALDYIRNGICDCAVVGGVDALSIVTACGFHSLKSLSSGICNPYDNGRDGINIGECGVFFLFESLASARKRNAKIYCEAVGYAIGNDAYHITSPEPDGEGAYRTMKAAIEDAGIKPSDIDYINGHGTGTLLNDAMETKAIEKLMEGRAVPLSSTKSMIGHCMGASGAIELASMILSMQNGKYIPMPGLSAKMEGNVEMSAQSYGLEIDYAMSNSFAFAGNSASIVIKKCGEA